MEEEKPLTLLELAKALSPKIKELKERIENRAKAKHQKELDELKKKIEYLKVEKQYVGEKEKLLAELEDLKKKSAEEKLIEVVE